MKKLVVTIFLFLSALCVSCELGASHLTSDQKEQEAREFFGLTDEEMELHKYESIAPLSKIKERVESETEAEEPLQEFSEKIFDRMVSEAKPEEKPYLNLLKKLHFHKAYYMNPFDSFMATFRGSSAMAVPHGGVLLNSIFLKDEEAKKKWAIIHENKHYTEGHLTPRRRKNFSRCEQEFCASKAEMTVGLQEGLFDPFFSHVKDSLMIKGPLLSPMPYLLWKKMPYFFQSVFSFPFSPFFLSSSLSASYRKGRIAGFDEVKRKNQDNKLGLLLEEYEGAIHRQWILEKVAPLFISKGKKGSKGLALNFNDDDISFLKNNFLKAPFRTAWKFLKKLEPLHLSEEQKKLIEVQGSTKNQLKDLEWQIKLPGMIQNLGARIKQRQFEKEEVQEV